MWSRSIKSSQAKSIINPCFTNNALQIKNVLKSNLGLTESVTNRILHKYPTIKRVDPEQMIDSIKILKLMKLSRTEIASYPLMLLRNDFVLIDNQHLLMEVGLKNVTAYRLHNFQQILNASVKFNQQFNFLPRDINIFEHIFDVAGIDIKIGSNVTYKLTDSLLKVHTIALVHYLQQRWNLSNEKIVETVNRTIFWNGRSIRGIEESIVMVEKTAKEVITAETMRTYYLKLFPEQIKTIFSLKTIYGIDIQALVSSAWRSLGNFSINRCLKSAEVLQKYDIPEYVVWKNQGLLFRNPVDLAEDLELISSILTDRKYFEHIYFGSLLINIRRLKISMEQQKINFYETVDEKFIDFFLNGFLFKRHSQILPYFRYTFNVTEDEARRSISSHPQWNKVSLVIIHKNIDFLLRHGFTHDEIFRDVHIVLYSLIEIKDILRKLNDAMEANQLGISTDLTNSQKLRLIVYFIEQKCGFNGEGVYLSSEQAEFEDNESVRMEAIINSCLKKGSHINLHDYVDDE